MGIFSSIKAYFMLFIGAVVLGFLAYMKYLRATNEEQKENIDRLHKEITVRKEVSKDEVKKAIFDAKQKTRVEAFKKSEITLDQIEKEVRENENNLHSSNVDFATSRV